MFSTTPRTFIGTCSATRPDRTATSEALGCGVVTTTSSAFGRVCATEIAMSPVPGARSSSSTSGSPHHTSDRNCSRERCSLGPRHRIARSAPANMPMEINLTPHAVTGISMPLRLVGCECTPNSDGRENP